jgi:hypothetical protein
MWMDEMRMTNKTKQYLERACQIHKNKYDYSLVSDITTNKQYIEIKCPIHGVFKQAVSSHVNAKQGCPRCGGNFRRTTEEVMDEIRKVHGDRFTYTPFQYKCNKQKIEIFCKVHGSFKTGVKEHLNGGGCPKCAKNAKMNTEDFIKKARKKHGDRYDYSKVDYRLCDQHVTITCRTHGDYLQTPHAHLAGYGCSRCVANSSRKENCWLDSLQIVGLLRQHKVKVGKRRYTVDGFDPKTNTIYEFNGDYFHGNYKYFDGCWTNRVTKTSFAELARKTREKEKALKQAGYTVVSIWESDYLASLGKEYRDEVDSTQRRVNQLAFIREWQLADDECFDWQNFAALLGKPKSV